MRLGLKFTMGAVFAAAILSPLAPTPNGAAAAAPTPKAAAAPAAPASPADEVKARQAHFKEMGKAMKALGDALKAGLPDPKVAVASSEQIHALSVQLPNWFPADSGPSSGTKTHAKAEIWSRPADFKAAAQGLQEASFKLEAAARGGDAKAIGAAMNATGKACGTCHKAFRTKEDD